MYYIIIDNNYYSYTYIRVYIYIYTPYTST